MGVKFGRKYEEIVSDFTEAIQRIDDYYQFFGMTPEDWGSLGESEQQECTKTLADDLFYALGESPTLQVGEGTVAYEKDKHVIKVDNGGNVVGVVNLV